MSISLTDAQTDAITNLARPLQPNERAGFFAELFETLLMRRDEVGDGELGRPCKRRAELDWRMDGVVVRAASQNRRQAITVAGYQLH